MKRKEAISIIYIADLHEANKELRYLFKKTAPDLYLIGGDLLYRPFYSYDSIIQFIDLQEELRDLAFTGKEALFPYDLSLQIVRENSDKTRLVQAQRYLELYSKALKNMKEKYQILENIFQSYTRVPVYILPGNYDLDPRQTALEKRNLHLKSVYFEDYKISGYGGADVFTPGIPEKLTVSYNAEENFSFFKKEEPDIAMVHKPAYGHFDRLASYGHIGSLSLAKLLEEKNSISLLLSGHVHTDAGIKKSNGTIYLNPGNLGKTIQPVGFSRGGFFSEITLDKDISKYGPHNCVRSVRRYFLSRGGIRLLEEKIFTLPEKLGKFGLFEEIKFFFRKFETYDTKIKVKNLINIARKIQQTGEHVAFDILGSVAFGMSQFQSDVDLVLYHFCPGEWTCDLHKCPKSLHYQDLILKNLLFETSPNRYKFEFIDCINIRLVLKAADSSDYLDDSLIRYLFYRKVGRGVNKKLLRSVDKHIRSNPGLFKKAYDNLNDLIDVFSATSSQKYSFEKYRERLIEMGINLPDSIQKKIFSYLGYK